MHAVFEKIEPSYTTPVKKTASRYGGSTQPPSLVLDLISEHLGSEAIGLYRAFPGVRLAIQEHIDAFPVVRAAWDKNSAALRMLRHMPADCFDSLDHAELVKLATAMHLMRAKDQWEVLQKVDKIGRANNGVSYGCPQATQASFYRSKAVKSVVGALAPATLDEHQNRFINSWGIGSFFTASDPEKRVQFLKARHETFSTNDIVRLARALSESSRGIMPERQDALNLVSAYHLAVGLKAPIQELFQHLPAPNQRIFAEHTNIVVALQALQHLDKKLCAEVLDSVQALVLNQFRSSKSLALIRLLSTAIEHHAILTGAQKLGVKQTLEQVYELTSHLQLGELRSMLDHARRIAPDLVPEHIFASQQPGSLTRAQSG